MRSFLFFLLLANSSLLAKEPYIPASQDVVLAKVRPSTRPTKFTAKKDWRVACAQARGFIEESRAKGDPRALGYAKAALSEWWTQSDAPEDVLLWRAVIKQADHDFASALSDLERYLTMHPRDAQAWQTRFDILMASGRLEEARTCLKSGVPVLPVLLAETDRTVVESLLGDAKSALSRLEASLAKEAQAPAAQRAWALTTAGEIAQRAGMDQAAELHFLSALAASPPTSYLKLAWADFLLAKNRGEELLNIWPVEEAKIGDDDVLLRIVLAERQIASAKEPDHLPLLRERFAATRHRGGDFHARTWARYLLEVENKPSEALHLAELNWKTQREPADADLLARARQAAKKQP